MYRRKRVKKTIKIGIIILVIIAAIIIVILYKRNNTSIDLNMLPELKYSEEEAKEFYTKTLIQHLDTFQNDFHIKYTAESTKEDGTKFTFVEEFSKKGNIASVYLSDENDRIILDSEKVYYIDDDEYLIYEVPKTEEISINMDILFYSLDSINEAFVKTGYETINEQKYYFEEYNMPKNEDFLIRYYFDEYNNIKYIKTYNKTNTEQTLYEIEMLENRTYDFMFNMDSPYEIYGAN